jgi:hypothetical protein
MPLVSYEDDESIDLFLRKQERAQRQQEREQRASAAQEIQDIDEPTEESGDFVTGVKAGFKQTQALGGGVKALAGSILGNEDMVKDGLLYYNEKMDEADRLGGNVTRVEDIESFGDSLDYMQYTLGTLVPDLLGGGLAGIAGKAAVKGVAKRTLKDAIDDRVQQAVADGAAEAGNKIALKKLRKEYEQEALGKIPQRAAIGGSALYSIGMNAGENFTEIEAETGKLDPVAALTVGVAQGALDSVGIPMRAFKKLFPDRSPEGLRTAIAEQLNDNRGAVRRIITESAKTAGAEGGIEALQEVMGRAAVAWANESLPESEQQEFFDIMAGENAQSLYINSLAAGFIGGSVIGGTVEGIRPKFDPADYDDRLGKMVEAKRAAKKAAAETDITPQEETIDLGEMPMDQESTAVYMGDMPAALQEQVFADGFEDDVVDIESVRQSVDKLEGIEQQRAKNALERLGLNQRQTRKVESPRQEVLLNFEGPLFTVSTPMTLKEKADELDQQVRSNTEKMQVSGDDTFVAESISLGKLMSSVSVNRGGRPQLDSKTEGADPVQLETIVDRYGRPRTPEEVPEVEEVMSIQLDLLDRGMPRQFVSGVQGVYALEGDIDLFDDAPAVYFPANKSIGVRPETLTEGLENEQTARDNRYTMAHELWHLADSENDYSATLPDLAMEFADTDGDGIPDLSVGDVVAELYDQWEQQTDLGKGFGYPFNYLEKDLADATPEERPAKLRAAQREVFAQLGAAFIANPKLLKDNAPNAYKLIKALRDNPSLRAEDIVREDNQTQADAVPTQPSGISGQVRAPPVEGSTEVQDDGGAGQASGVGPETGQTDSQLGEPEEREDGDAAGRVLRQKVTDFVASQGEVQGVSPIQLELRQGYNPTVELIDEMLADGALVETIGPDGAPVYTVPEDQQVDPMRRRQLPITNAVDRAKQKYADYSASLEEEFFGKHWPRLMAEVGGTVSPEKTKTAAKRAVQDISDWVRDNPKYNNYYSEDMAAVRQSLEEYFDNFTDDDLLFFQVANGLTSPATSLRGNVGDAVRVLDLFKREGNLDSIVMGVSAKGNAVIDSSPISISGTTGPTKARSLKVFDRLIKEKGGVRQAVDFLKEGVTPKELQAFNREMGYVSKIPGMPAIKSLVKSATGQDELVPRFFIFNKKIGAYTMNLSGDPRYTTIDIWESRFIRSYFDGLYEENTGLPATASESVLFQEFSNLFKEEFDRITGTDADPSTLQAMRWFYMINAAREAGYRGASTNETISEITAQQLQKLGGGRETGGRASDETVAAQDESQPQPIRTPASTEGEVGNERQRRIRDRAERLQSGGIAPLDGAPIIKDATGPDPRIVAAAEEYAEQNGIPFSRQETYVEVSPERAARIAQAYDEMEHNPQDPAVKEAYDDLIRQTRDQYDFLVDAGYEFTFFDSETDPYDGNPWNAMRDLRNNQRMAVYGTYDGYGTEGITDGDVDDNPLLVDTGLRWKDQNGVDQVVTGNDLFRAVHDAFGHGIEGAGFRARGEENAWQAHARLFTGPGLAALTSETRGQNSWLNFGPFGETNQTASVLDTVFAEQKAGLMPEWTWSEAGPATQQDDAPQPMRVRPTYNNVDARQIALSDVVRENENIPYHDSVRELEEESALWIEELDASPRFKRLLRALDREDYLGFDTVDQALRMLFKDGDPLENFDVSPGFKSAVGRYVNEVNDFKDDSPQYIRVPEPDNADISFNLNDDVAVDKSVDSAIKKLVPVEARRKLTDRLERLKELERRFAAKLGLDRLPSIFSAYDNENLMHSKVQKQLEDFEEKYVVPIAEMIKGAGLEIEQAGLYLLAKHAPERNARIAEQERELREQQIAALEDQMAALDDDAEYARMAEKLDVLKNAPFKYQEKGSGLTNEEAESIIELAESEGQKESLESIASEVYQMLTDMRQNMVDQGLLDNRTREDWEETYQFYVPLKGFAAFPEGLEMKGGNGTQGFSIKGSESFKARGRVTLPVNPLTVAMKDAEEKIVRAEKNRTAQKLLKMFEKFQSPDNWRVYNQKVRPPRDSNPAEMKSNQEMRSERRPDDGLPRYIEVKRRGKSFFIEVRDRELNRQLQSGGVGMFNNQVDFMNKALTYAQSFQNFRRNMLINYNPSWGLVNPLRDIQTGLAFAISELDAKEGRLAGKFEGATDLTFKVAKSYTPSLKAFYRARRGTEGKTAEAKEFDQYTREYIEDGAPTGITITKSLEEQQERFKNIMGQSLKAKGINKMRPLFDWVEDANQTTENAARLATYIEARKAGVERTDAATLAKDLTVNFNRKGEYSSAIDSLYLFFNAAVQGNVNILKALTRGKKEGGISKAQTLAASMVMFGFARTLANISMAGEDDDGESNYVDYNEYVMKTAMVFTDGRQGIAMPMPYGYGLLDNIGRFGAEMVMGIKTPEQTAVDLATSVDHHFNPMSLHATGDDRDMIEAAILKGMFLLSPDIGDFFIEQVANVNFFGSNIAIPQNPLLVQKPDAYMSKRGTNEFITAATEFLNDATGGSPYRSGFFDANPERLMHFYEFMMGGVGRFLDDSSDTVMKMISEEPDLLPKDIPIVRTFMPMASEFSDRVDFYSNRSNYEQYRTEYKESNVAERRALQQRFGARLYQFDVVHKNIEKQLRALSKQKKALYDDKVIDSMVRWKRLQAIAEQEERLFDEYNRRFNEVKP